MQRLVDELLTLARLDPASRTPVQERRREPAGAGRRGRPAGAAAGPAGDRDRRRGGAGAGADESGLRQVLGNLLGNVRVHTPVEAPVALAVTREAGVVPADRRRRGPWPRRGRRGPRLRPVLPGGRGRQAADSEWRSCTGWWRPTGGEVSVRTEPGAGFTVTVYLPVGRPAATEGRDLRNGRGLRRGRDLRNGQGLRRGRDLRNGRSPRRGKGLRNGRSPRRGRGLRRGLGGRARLLGTRSGNAPAPTRSCRNGPGATRPTPSARASTRCRPRPPSSSAVRGGLTSGSPVDSSDTSMKHEPSRVPSLRLELALTHGPVPYRVRRQFRHEQDRDVERVGRSRMTPDRQMIAHAQPRNSYRGRVPRQSERTASQHT